MKTVVCYYSRHHGNTRKLVEAIAREGEVDLIDVTAQPDICLDSYDCIGLAAGIYYGTFPAAVLQFARQRLPAGKAVFLIFTYGARRPGYTTSVRNIAREKGCQVLGEFGCRGYDTFGPFRLVGGIAKGHPDEQDLEHVRRFYQKLKEQQGGRTQP